MSTRGFTEFSDLPLLNIEESGKTPNSRLKDVKAATDIFLNLRRGDEASAVNRSRVQSMFDGSPPYSESKLRATGQGFRCNLNFGEGEKFLENAMSAYVDLINSVETLVRLETTYGDPNQRVNWNRVISEEYSFQLRKWPRFDYEYLNLCNHFVGHGVGINYHEDERAWHWRSTGLGDILIPRQTQATEGAIEVAAARRTMMVNELYRFIEDPEVATQLGWDVKEVRKAILDASSITTSTTDWERFQTEIKNNDLWHGAKAAKVDVFHMWVKEFNGTVSHFISLCDGKNEEFLYKRVGRYRNISQAFTFFPYGIGTNGTYHGIRGLGFKIFHHIQVNNRMWSQAVDNAMLAGAPMIQPEDDRALENFAFTYFGPFAVLPPNAKFLDRAAPNLTQGMMPVLNSMNQMLQERAGQYSAAGVFGVARRFFRPDYSQDELGGEAVFEFRERCVTRGVPLEALEAIDIKKTRTVRAVGNGSQAKRSVSLQQLNELAGVFDEEGRHNLFRDQVASLVGQDSADRYIPNRPDSRVPVDAKVAELENAHLSEGNTIPVYPNELHVVHLDVHLPAIEEMFQAVEEGQIDLIEATQQTMLIFDHSVQHLENIQQDISIQERVAEFNQRLQQVSEMIINGQKAMAKADQEAAEAGAQEGVEGGQPQITPEQQQKLLESRLKIQMMQEKHQAEMMIRLQKAEQDRQIADAKAATNLRDFLR
jgi:hypothetical protein